MSKIKSTTFDYELADESTVKMSLNFRALKELSVKKKETYKIVNQLMLKGQTDTLQSIDFLYAGYVCGNIDGPLMTYSEFVEKMNDSITYNQECVEQLFGRSKN